MTNVIADNADNDFASTMKFEGIASIGDILAIPQGDLDTLQRSDPETQEAIPVRRFVKGIITALQGIIHQRSLDGNPLDDSNWTSLTKEAFDEYRMTASFNTFPQTIGRNPAMAVRSTTNPRSPADDFRKGIRRDPTLFKPLKDEKMGHMASKHYCTSQCTRGRTSTGSFLQTKFSPRQGPIRTTTTICLFCLHLDSSD